MSKFFHSADLKDLKVIKSSGVLKAPLFVYKEDAVPYNPARDSVIELDLSGYKLRKDPHPYASEEYYIVDRDVPVSRITNIEYYWGIEPLEIKEVV